MNKTIEIDTACIRCGRCVRVCPSLVLAQEKKGGDISVPAPGNCISCGHCVAACPVSAVRHSDFPPDKVHAFDRAELPTPEQVMLLCRARRSNRAFTSTPVPEASLEQILEAAHRAPTASNIQQVRFTLITDPEKLRSVSRFTVDTFAAAARKLENPLLKPLLRRIMPDAYGYLPAFHRLMEQQAKGNDLILRGATALLLIHTPSKNRFGLIDANLAYQNGSLMAESLGVSQFYTGFVYSAARMRKGVLEKMLGIDGVLHAGMALGMPAFLFTNYIDREPIRISR